MQETNLAVKLRKELGSRRVRRVRRENFIPAIVYGGEREATNVKVEKSLYQHIMRQHVGETVLFHLNVFEDGKKLRDYSAIVKDEQHDPVSDEILHIDFYRISLDKKIEVPVGIEAKGTPVGVEKDGGSLDHHLWELDVICLPINIPKHIEVDVSHLEINDTITVGDLSLPKGVETERDPEDVVLSVSPPREEEPEPETEEEVEPEVIGKEGEEGAEEGEAEGEAEEKEGEGKSKGEDKGESKDEDKGGKESGQSDEKKEK